MPHGSSAWSPVDTASSRLGSFSLDIVQHAKLIISHNKSGKAAEVSSGESLECPGGASPLGQRIPGMIDRGMGMIVPLRRRPFSADQIG